MGVGDAGGEFCFRPNTVKVIREECSQGRDSHRPAISHRALSPKSIRGEFLEIFAAEDFGELNASAASITAIRLALESIGEASGERGLIDVTVKLEHLDDGDRH